ncbi:MAG: hypothetical protein LUQ50_15170 [Methanospirillum sp.]|uniref:hypothetical protein n=1 Tax=Methanospirillum sp. TaxID=45200 RepID=UPI00236B102B|nr:hypothetical protein [Methanospirillum sp.]MDD1730394.1 hypothetical protein [Methanospirillum sp.]
MVLLVVSGLIGVSGADRLPSTVSETQQITIDTQIDAIATVDVGTKMDWQTVRNGSTTDTSIGKGEIISTVVYVDSVLSNGGDISVVKNIGFDSSNMMRDKMYNLESEKVMTYAGSSGSHLVGAESLILDVRGNYTSNTSESVACVFSDTNLIHNPMFENVVEAQSDVLNLNKGQISTKAEVRAVGSSISTSAGMNYQIAVTPDSNSHEDYANGIVKTNFAGDIMEARDKKPSGSKKDAYVNDWKKPAATNKWRDSTEVNGNISSIQKAFNYKSGLKL